MRTIEFRVTDTESLTGSATMTLNLIPTIHTPPDVMATVNEDTLSAPIILLPNPLDGGSVTDFQITGITNGTLYKSNGVTVIHDGDFITTGKVPPD